MLQEFLSKKNYLKIKLHLSKSNHFEVIVKLNGIKGLFILDTGASNSCVDSKCAHLFKLIVKPSDVKAAGAGANNMITQQSVKNKLTIGKWEKNNINVVIFSLIHVNAALIDHNARPIHGIIGSDILKKGKAIIDYDKKYLYLRHS